ncbi:MAG: hypothetical protein IT210_19490 [Armatimonadetes bacterium]|nr:hypothetical protein [Armatimonadota bacterium]
MKPIALHPDNPRYFLLRNRPAVLITSGEHYGAVLNQDFDYIPYLDELQSRGFNLTRTFTGAYMEDAASFGIKNNTLAPLKGRLICPWARSKTPGYAYGGNKFDLNKWDAAYFRRLKDFIRQAGRRGVVVELVLFCPFYDDSQWKISPMNADNNINGVGGVPKDEVYALKHPDLTAAQEALTRKIVRELASFPNLYYEICNEPYFGGVTLEWQRRIASIIAEEEADLPAKHLIAQNIANHRQKIENPDPNVSIFNFHYANPPVTVEENWGLNRPIGFDESGFRGSDNLPYRTEAWEFILAGGSVYSNLDYSFTAAHPAGTSPVDAPGGGGPALRSQLKILKDFIHGFKFLKMAPDREAIQEGVPAGAAAYALSEPGRQYAIYIRGGEQASLTLALPKGHYRAEWLNPRTGVVEKHQEIAHAGGPQILTSPEYVEDIALKIVAGK